MPNQSRASKSPFRAVLAGLGGMGFLTGGCAAGSGEAQPLGEPSFVIEADAAAKRPPFKFGGEDEILLDEVQRGCFNFFWNGANAKTGMVPDRTSVTTISTAGVGFQLAALPIGVERGWITRDQGFERAKLILDSLARDPDIRHEGLFQHFIDGDTAGPHSNKDLEHVVSTIDSGLLISGMLVASSYFGGEVQAQADALVAQANWKAFVSGKWAKEHEQGYISLGWRPRDKAESTGPGDYLPYYWVDSGDEHKLVTFLAVCSPNEQFRVEPATYYKLRRQIGEYPGVQPFSWFPWSGALFTNFFAHCFIDYSAIGVDNPMALEVTHRAGIDWWENSRRAVKFHQIRAVEKSGEFPTFGEDSWGFTAADCTTGYQVPGIYPKLKVLEGAREKKDFDTFKPKDDFGDGSMAPYGAASSIMFDPSGAIRAMRHYKDLKNESGQALAWRDPATGGYGFVDSFRVASGSQKAWAAADVLSIDQGPMILAIENARTGLVWRLFHEHPYVKAGMDRLKMKRSGR